MAKGKVQKKSKNATVIQPEKSVGTIEWLEEQGIEQEDESVVLFKRVSSNMKTQEDTSNETTWMVGSELDHPSVSNRPRTYRG